MAVVLIMAIAAGVVVLRVEGPMNNARMRDVVDQVSAFDSLSRARAVEQDAAVRMTIDSGAGLLKWAAANAKESFSPAVRLPDGYAVREVRVRGNRVEGATADIVFSRLGLSPSYAVLLEGPGGRRQWMLFAGLTGQMVEASDETEITNIFAAAGAGLHAG
jgi:type II secretory pathway pseudopilin PulG